MQSKINFKKEINTLEQTIHGDCKIKNLALIFDEMEKYELKPDLKILADITNADLTDENFDTVSFLEIKLDQFLDKYMPIKKAIIAESDLEFGIARMYQMIAEKDGFDVMVFREKTPAINWLHQ